METTAAFLCLGHTVVYNNSDWASLYHNLKKSQRRWVMVTKVLTKLIVVVRERSNIYKVVFHMVFLYGSYIWVVAVSMLMVLERSCQQVAK